MHAWTVQDAVELYDVQAWGGEFFTVNRKGNIEVRPRGKHGPAIDLAELVAYLQDRDLKVPMLIRFSDILEARIRSLHDSFTSAIEEHAYQGHHRPVYPIKVNQQRHVVEEVVEFGRPYSVGLEAGSKPELLAILPTVEDPNALIVCNGYKDRAYIEIALLAQKLGRNGQGDLPFVALGDALLIGGRRRGLAGVGCALDESILGGGCRGGGGQG